MPEDDQAARPWRDGTGALPPELSAGLAELPPEQQAGLAAAARRYAALSPAEQAETRAAADRELVDHQIGQVVEAVQDAMRRGRLPALLPRLAEAAAANRHIFPELARFIDAVAGLLQGERQDPPAAYRAPYEALAAQLAQGGSPRSPVAERSRDQKDTAGKQSS